MYYQFDYSVRMEWTKLIVVILSFACLECQHNPHFWPNRSAIVHLFEWKWNDIGDECERFLAPRGYAGVQTSPANENIIINNRPWWERYQPISYKLITRSGNEEEFANMVRRCNQVGVRIYVDVVINHMAAPSVNSIGTGGSVAGPESTHFPAVPYSYLDFNLPCGIENYNDPIQVRNCDLVGLKDLNHRVPWVRDRVIEFLNKLIGLGVAGFRIDAAKHMWPEDLKIIYDNLRDLNMSHGFPEKSRPFIYQEVIDFGGESISKYQYTPLGVVTEFKFAKELGLAFRGHNDLKWLSGFGPLWGLLPSQQALVFIDNHDNQRGHGSGSADILTHKDSRRYKMATAFALAYPYGFTRIMSSYAFDYNDHGPPSDSQQNILSPIIHPDNTCGNGWICEHRWRQIYNMVDFKNQVRGTNVTNWWSNDKNRISFCRGEKGFIAFNGEESDMDEDLQTCLPEGIYCDIISGEKKGKKCSGKYVVVYKGGRGKVIIRSSDEDGVIAIHLESKIW